MKKIIVACGAGVATSTMISHGVSKFLNENNIKHYIIQCTLQEVELNTDEADLVITSMPLKKKFSIPVVVGTTFLTNLGVDKTKEEILKYLKN